MDMCFLNFSFIYLVKYVLTFKWVYHLGFGLLHYCYDLTLIIVVVGGFDGSC
jgi:hypothetical protein